jgi:hypothetical protein
VRLGASAKRGRGAGRPTGAVQAASPARSGGQGPAAFGRSRGPGGGGDDDDTVEAAFEARRAAPAAWQGRGSARGGSANSGLGGSASGAAAALPHPAAFVSHLGFMLPVERPAERDPISAPRAQPPPCPCASAWLLRGCALPASSTFAAARTSATGPTSHALTGPPTDFTRDAAARWQPGLVGGAAAQRQPLPVGGALTPVDCDDVKGLLEAAHSVAAAAARGAESLAAGALSGSDSEGGCATGTGGSGVGGGALVSAAQQLRALAVAALIAQAGPAPAGRDLASTPPAGVPAQPALRHWPSVRNNTQRSVLPAVAPLPTTAGPAPPAYARRTSQALGAAPMSSTVALPLEGFVAVAAPPNPSLPLPAVTAPSSVGVHRPTRQQLSLEELEAMLLGEDGDEGGNRDAAGGGCQVTAPSACKAACFGHEQGSGDGLSSAVPQPTTEVPGDVEAEAPSSGVDIAVSRSDATSADAPSAQATAAAPLVRLGRKPRWRSGLMPIFMP